MLLRDLLFALFLACAGVLTSVDASGPLRAERPLEARVHEVAASLDCGVCPNRSVAEAQSGLAVDLRGEIRERLRSGASVEEVTDFMVARYGDFVGARVPVTQTGWLLWCGRLLLVGCCAGFVVLSMRRRGDGRRGSPAAIDDPAAVGAEAQ